MLYAASWRVRSTHGAVVVFTRVCLVELKQGVHPTLSLSQSEDGAVNACLWVAAVAATANVVVDASRAACDSHQSKMQLFDRFERFASLHLIVLFECV